MQKLSDYIRERAIAEEKYVIEKQTTVRATARAYNVSKSTVHKDITEKLSKIDFALYEEVEKILQLNKSERHIRGGEATKRKYQKIHFQK